MTLQNRVGPDGIPTAAPVRGTMTGNRGILHVADGQMGAAIWKHRAWISCTLNWQGRRRKVMSGRKWTELFFLDEVVALAAGHRPCGYCRRAAFERFKAAWDKAIGRWPGVQAVDARLHHERAEPGARRLRHHWGRAEDLPNGAMYHFEERDWAVLDGGARPFADDHWGPVSPLPHGPVMLRTAPSLLTVLRAGYGPQRHGGDASEAPPTLAK